MIERRILEATRQALIDIFGNLNDLPHELANTVANKCYRHQASLADQIENPLPLSVKAMEERITSTAEWDPIPKMVYALRDVIRSKNQRAIDISVEIYLAILKYGIDDVESKSIIRLRFERLLNRHKVNEIPDLIDRLSLPPV